MDLFSWLPVIIFIYAVSTIFSPNNNKKPQNRRPPNSRPTPYSQQETKPTRPNWRDKFEELERELFPREVRPPQSPRPTSTTPYPTYQEYGREGLEGSEGYSTEGTWGSEGTWGTEGIGGSEGSESWEGTLGNEGTSGLESRLSTQKGKGMLGKPDAKQGIPAPQLTHQQRPVLPVISESPLVQGVIWAEILGKPRAHSGFSYKRRG